MNEGEDNDGGGDEDKVEKEHKDGDKDGRLGFFFYFEPLKGITYTPSIHMPLNNFLLQAEAKPG